MSITIAGLLGGALSTVSHSVTLASSLPLVRVAFIRPLIGAVAGLALYFVSSPDILKVSYPFLYVAAMAFGFSERAFTTAVGSSANEIAKGVGQALGHKGGKSK